VEREHGDRERQYQRGREQCDEKRAWLAGRDVSGWWKRLLALIGRVVGRQVSHGSRHWTESL
jgi:hypothetical protein